MAEITKSPNIFFLYREVTEEEIFIHSLPDTAEEALTAKGEPLPGDLVGRIEGGRLYSDELTVADISFPLRLLVTDPPWPPPPAITPEEMEYIHLQHKGVQGDPMWRFLMDTSQQGHDSREELVANLRDSALELSELAKLVAAGAAAGEANREVDND